MRRLGAFLTVSLAGAALGLGSPVAHAGPGRIAGGSVLRVSVPEAFGGKTVIGQLTVANPVGAGFVTAYGCDDGLPVDARGAISRSDLNYDGSVSPTASNRMIVQADGAGDVCLYTSRPAALILDVNAVTFDTGVSSFPNRRTDTRQQANPLIEGHTVMRVNVPEAVGGRTVIGQLTVDMAQAPGFVTAYGCADGIPTDAAGRIARSDVNYGWSPAVASNRLVVQADARGDVCLYTLAAAALILDVNGVADSGIASFPNRRTDTRLGANPIVGAGQVLRVRVPEAVGAKTVFGQLTVDRATTSGFVTAYACDEGLPRHADGTASRSDLNVEAAASPVASNRLIVQADADGDVCFFTLSPAALIVDVNAVAGIAVQSFPNRRVDTRFGGSTGSIGPVPGGGVPVWAPYAPAPAVAGVAALTGRAASATVRNRPILAVKIDNYRLARPPAGLERADAVFEQNVEGVTRFVALFQTQLPNQVGPIRSARTQDLDLLAGMNRPVFAFSGANAGVTAWIDSAESSGVLVDLSAQHSPCYSRTPVRPGPHDLLLDATCAVGAVGGSGGPARPLWRTDAGWRPAPGAPIPADTTFVAAMDGVTVEWRWDATYRVYQRYQDGLPHVAESGAPIVAANVVEIGVVYVPSPVDSRSPHAVTVGSGTAVVHRDGLAIPVQWSRSSASAPFEFVDAHTGAPVPLDTGITFVELERVT